MINLLQDERSYSGPLHASPAARFDGLLHPIYTRMRTAKCTGLRDVYASPCIYYVVYAHGK